MREDYAFCVLLSLKIQITREIYCINVQNHRSLLPFVLLIKSEN